MSRASQIVNALLEADESADIPPEDVEPERYLNQYADEIERDARNGKLTLQTALTAPYFWHRTIKYRNGRSAIKVRRNGATKTWKTRPGEFRIPVKYGFREYFYITNANANEWSTVPIPDLPKPAKSRANKDCSKTKPVANPSSLMPPPTI